VVAGRVDRAAQDRVHPADLVDRQADRLAVTDGDEVVTAALRAGSLSTGGWPLYLDLWKVTAIYGKEQV
jgi:hypothetical protein